MVDAEGEFRSHSMEAAVVDLGANESLSTVNAVKVAQSRVELHENFLPWEILLLSEEKHELVDVPGAVSHMLSDHSAMKVDKDLGLGTPEPLSL